MKTYVLYGPSGSGKSYQARIISHKYNIPLIIDDGLLIWEGRILAGKSAKQEKTKVTAIKRALFYEDEQVEEVKEAMEETDADKILILGTSRGMVERIVERLDLTPIDVTMEISDVVSQEEIEMAQEIRRKSNSHIIPVPTIEVKHQFPFVDTIELFFQNNRKPVKTESSIVRPRFSNLGNLVIYNKVFDKFIKHFLENIEDIRKFSNINVHKTDSGLEVNITVVLSYGIKIHRFLSVIQKELKQYLEQNTGVRVKDITITVSSLLVE
ncbi:MAG: Asp23/Gls24 family envelope stress response protein [Bacillota bacterium]